MALTKGTKGALWGAGIYAILAITLGGDFIINILMQFGDIGFLSPLMNILEMPLSGIGLSALIGYLINRRRK